MVRHQPVERARATHEQQRMRSRRVVRGRAETSQQTELAGPVESVSVISAPV